MLFPSKRHFKQANGLDLQYSKQCIHWGLIPLVAIAMTLWPTLSSGLRQLQTDPGDTLLNLYFLEHAYHHFKSLEILKPSLYWSPDFFWPIKDTLAWSDHLLGPSLIYAFFRTFLDPYQSYVGWLISTLWLNYVSIRIAVSWISPQALPIWLSITSLAATFSPTILQQINHPQLLSLFLIGPILWQCHRLICLQPEEFQLRDWLILGTLLLGNGFFNIYIFVYACYGVLTCSAIHLLKRVRLKKWDLHIGGRLPRYVTLFTGCLALNLIIYIPYLQTIRTFGKRPTEEILNNLPTAASWLYGSNQWLMPSPLNPTNLPSGWITGVEQELFPGWSLCILLGAAIITTAIRRNRSNQTDLIMWLLALTAMIIGCLSIHHWSLWPIISKFLPGSSSLRASSRVGLIIVLFSTPFICLASNDWLIHPFRKWHSIYSVAAILGTFVAIWPAKQPAFSLETWKSELHAITDKLLKSDCNVFWYEWNDQEPWRAQVIGMFAQQATGIPTANGYSGHFPKENWPFTNPLGESAFMWILKSNPGQYHNIKPLSNSQKFCIATYSSKEGSKIREFDKSMPARIKAQEVSKIERILFNNDVMRIARKGAFLYFQEASQPSDSKWKMLIRDGTPIPANRGDYRIANVQISQLDGNIILVTDKNEVLRIEYEWQIDRVSGIFIGQTMKEIPHGEPLQVHGQRSHN